MKTILLATALAFTTTFASANSPAEMEDVKISLAVEQSFMREFGTIKDVKWTETRSHMYRATFEVFEETTSAFFTNEGKLVATTVNRDVKQLPAKLRHNISRKFEDATISEVFEMTTDNEHCYYFKAEKDGKAKLYKGYSSGGIQQSQIALN